ncbi:YceH family protein [Tautonia rosea]|uniref:YceH family protein n=1 Tax=Tautonia rosea TaxID=2728037 RepID=UPI001474FEB0|nr:DUF480 domain-containing protein [Tautonia rosea]
MSDASNPPERRWSPLSLRERRVLGVLVEKQKTTPDVYPMSIAGIVTGCNQKSNRDPVTSYDADDVEEILIGLRKKGAAIQVEGSGRVEKWRHNLYEWLDLKGQGVAMAVLAELMLRGAQTVGELRGRAARMDPIPDLETLQPILEKLAELGLVVFLTPPGQRRGVTVTHGLMPPEELERVRQSVASASDRDDDEPRPTRSSSGGSSAGLAAEVASLRAEVEGLRGIVETLSAEMKTLKASLGE